MPFQSLQQNLNQISQICNQLSQNEQANATQLQQMQQAEQAASQQLRQCVQLCNQVVTQMQQMQQMQQMPQMQFSNVGQSTGYTAPGAGFAGNWSNRPINTSNAFVGGQSGQFGSFETSKELQPTGQAVFNTNKDLGK